MLALPILALAFAPPSMEGRVLHFLTAQPLPKVAITVRDDRGRQLPGALTDDSGRFALFSLPPGRYRLRAERAGFLPAEFPTVLSLQEGQRLIDLNLRLTPHSVLSGRVSAPDGEPLSDAAIYCFQFVYSRGRKVLSPIASATTDDRGQYRLPGLAPASYLVAAVYQPTVRFIAGTGGTAHPARESWTPLFYPNSTDATSASPVITPPGQDVQGVDFVLQPAPAVRLRGRIAPLIASHVSLRLVPRHSESAFFLVRNAIVQPATGVFEVPDVTPGAYALAAESSDGDTRYFASLPVDVSSQDLDGLELTLTPAPSLSGSIQCDTALPAVSLSLQPADNPFAASLSTRVDSGASFLFRSVPPGVYVLSLKGLPDGFYLQSIRCGALEIPEDAVPLSAGAALLPLTISIGRDAGRVAGIVTTAQSDRHAATVVLIPSSPRFFSRYQRVLTDQDGAFSIPSVAPGEYSAYAFEFLEPGAEFDADTLAPHRRSARPFTLRPSAAKTLNLPLIRSGDNR